MLDMHTSARTANSHTTQTHTYTFIYSQISLMKQKYCKRAQAKQTHFFPKYTGTVDSLGFNVYLHGEIEYESSKEIKKTHKDNALYYVSESSV